MDGAQFIGLTMEELKALMKAIFVEALNEYHLKGTDNREKNMTIGDACRYLKVSAPTLKKLVDKGTIRRHDLGGRKKIFYLSELEQDVKRIQLFNGSI